jgi:hypothetical protein
MEIHLNRSGTHDMLIVYSCLIILFFGIIDAFIFKSIRVWEASRLKNIQQREHQLTVAYKNKVKETQKLKARAEELRIECSAASKLQKSHEKNKIPAPAPRQGANIALQLLKQGAVTREQLQKAQKYKQLMNNDKPLEEILVILGALKQETLDKLMQS